MAMEGDDDEEDMGFDFEEVRFYSIYDYLELCTHVC